MNREKFNKEMLRLLKGKGTETFIDYVEGLGFTIDEVSEYSEQGYPLIEYKGRQLVISRDRSNRTRLFTPYSSISDYRRLKHVDFYRYFEKIKHSREEVDRKNSEMISRSYALDKVRFNQRQIKEIKEKIEALEKEVEYYKEDTSNIKRQYKKELINAIDNRK